MRYNMINGVGPMQIVKNRMDFCMWPGKRSYRIPDEWSNSNPRGENVFIKGEEKSEDGIIAFATANQFVLVSDYNNGNFEPKGSDLSKMKQSCIDFAPFLFQHNMPKGLVARSS